MAETGKKPTKDDILRMAREANNGKIRDPNETHMFFIDELERFFDAAYAAGAAAEREACADICGGFAMNAAMNELEGYDAYRDCEEAILARNQA